VKKLIYIVGGIVLALLLVVAVLPFVIDVNRFRPDIERLMSEALNRKVTIGNIQLSLLSGGVAVDDLIIGDDPAFSRNPFLTAKSVAVGVELQPLIFSRALHVTGLSIEQPQATLLRNAAGAWNFSTLGAGESSKASATPPRQQAASGGSGDVTQGLAIQNVALRNGVVNVGTTGANSKLHKYEQVNLTATNLSYRSQFPFDLSLVTPGNGSIALQGQAGPLNQADMQKTPVNASLEAKRIDLTATGFVEPASGSAGIVDFSGTLNSDGKQVITKGTATANKLQLAPGGSPAGEPVQLAYQTNYQIAGQSGVLQQGDVRVGKALAQLTGTYRTQGDTTSLQMKLKGSDMPATDISTLLPALGVVLPAGAALKEGALNMDMTISGPVDRLVTSGPIGLSNAKLTGFDLGSKMKMLATFAGIPSGSDTLIQTLASDLRLSTDGIRADNFSLVVPAIGSLTGNGTISPKQELNFIMSAKLANASNPLGALASLASRAGGGQNGGIPFRIQGTTSNPTFIPDLKGLAGGLGGQAASGGKAVVPAGQSLGEALGGLFGRKKTQ
jgi:AsmA protein